MSPTQFIASFGAVGMKNILSCGINNQNKQEQIMTYVLREFCWDGG